MPCTTTGRQAEQGKTRLLIQLSWDRLHSERSNLHSWLFFYSGPTGEQIEFMVEGLFLFEDDSKWPNLLQDNRNACFLN